MERGIGHFSCGWVSTLCLRTKAPSGPNRSPLWLEVKDGSGGPRRRHRPSLLILPAVEGDVARRTTAVSSPKVRWVLRRNGLLSVVHCGCGLALDRLGQRRQLRSELVDLCLVGRNSGEDSCLAGGVLGRLVHRNEGRAE